MFLSTKAPLISCEHRSYPGACPQSLPQLSFLILTKSHPRHRDQANNYLYLAGNAKGEKAERQRREDLAQRGFGNEKSGLHGAE